MQFLKKNYEKILLGLVLFGLVGTVVFLLFYVANEKQAQEERRTKIINRSTLLRSWRTLPGQLCACSTAMASSLMRRGLMPACLAICFMKPSTR